MIKNIKIGHSTFVLLENGDLWGCGNNQYGELGLKHTNPVYTFTKICEDVEKINCYWWGTLIFKKDKTLWFAGKGSILNELSNISTFKKIASDVKNVLPQAKKLSSKNSFLCLKNNGDLIDILSKKVFSTNVKKIECADHFFIIKEDNSLWKLENMSFVKVLDNVKYIFPKRFQDSSFLVLKTDNSLWKFEDNNFKNGFKLLDNIKSIDYNSSSLLLLREDDVLFAFGSNYFSELGNETKSVNVPIIIAENIKKFCLGTYFSVFLKKDNTLWGCGKNDYDIFEKMNKDFYFPSFKKIDDNVKNFSLDSYSLFIIKQNDELWTSGWFAKYFQGNDYLRFVSDNVKNVFSNSFSFFILKKDNSLLGFGDNKNGQLGINPQKEWIENLIVNNTIKNYYTAKETVKVISNVFKGANL